MSKKRCWNDAFGELGFIRESNLEYPSARCCFCSTVYNNSSLDKNKLKRHRDTVHAEHCNKSVDIFKQQTKNFVQQQQTFKNIMTPKTSQGLVVSSFKIAHQLMVAKKPFTLAENVIKPCLEIVARELHGGAAKTEVKKLSLSDNSMQRRCALIADSLKEQVLAKLHDAPCFGLQLDETTDITREAQLIVYVRFPDKKSDLIEDHYLYCIPVGVDTTAASIFSNVDHFFREHSIVQSCLY